MNDWWAINILKGFCLIILEFSIIHIAHMFAGHPLTPMMINIISMKDDRSTVDTEAPASSIKTGMSVEFIYNNIVGSYLKYKYLQ